jgi:hypothetical protein
MDFQGIFLFVQSLPTSTWKDSDMDRLLAEAYVLYNLYNNAPNHLQPQQQQNNQQQ